jgi:hypothetical protein
VPAVVKHDVWRAELLDDPLKKFGIALVADANGDLIFFVFLAGGINVDPDDLGERAEVSLPELERASLQHADLDERRWPIHKRSKMALIDRKVVGPFVDWSSFVSQKL